MKKVDLKSICIEKSVIAAEVQRSCNFNKKKLIKVFLDLLKVIPDHKIHIDVDLIEKMPNCQIEEEAFFIPQVYGIGCCYMAEVKEIKGLFGDYASILQIHCRQCGTDSDDTFQINVNEIPTDLLAYLLRETEKYVCETIKIIEL